MSSTEAHVTTAKVMLVGKKKSVQVQFTNKKGNAVRAIVAESELSRELSVLRQTDPDQLQGMDVELTESGGQPTRVRVAGKEFQAPSRPRQGRDDRRGGRGGRGDRDGGRGRGDGGRPEGGRGRGDGGERRGRPDRDGGRGDGGRGRGGEGRGPRRNQSRGPRSWFVPALSRTLVPAGSELGDRAASDEQEGRKAGLSFTLRLLSPMPVAAEAPEGRQELMVPLYQDLTGTPWLSADAVREMLRVAFAAATNSRLDIRRRQRRSRPETRRVRVPTVPARIENGQIELLMGSTTTFPAHDPETGLWDILGDDYRTSARYAAWWPARQRGREVVDMEWGFGLYHGRSIWFQTALVRHAKFGFKHWEIRSIAAHEKRLREGEQKRDAVWLDDGIFRGWFFKGADRDGPWVEHRIFFQDESNPSRPPLIPLTAELVASWERSMAAYTKGRSLRKAENDKKRRGGRKSAKSAKSGKPSKSAAKSNQKEAVKSLPEESVAAPVEAGEQVVVTTPEAVSEAVTAPETAAAEQVAPEATVEPSPEVVPDTAPVESEVAAPDAAAQSEVAAPDAAAQSESAAEVEAKARDRAILCYAEIDGTPDAPKIRSLHAHDRITRTVKVVEQRVEDGLEPARGAEQMSPAERLFGVLFGRGGKGWGGTVQIKAIEPVGETTLDEFPSPVPIMSIGPNARPVKKADKNKDAKNGKAADSADQKNVNGAEAKDATEVAAKDAQAKGGQAKAKSEENTPKDKGIQVSGRLPAGTSFRVDLDVSTLGDEELGGLLWLLSLGEKHALRVGGGKGFGLGGMALKLESLQLAGGELQVVAPAKQAEPIVEAAPKDAEPSADTSDEQPPNLDAPLVDVEALMRGISESMLKSGISPSPRDEPKEKKEQGPPAFAKPYIKVFKEAVTELYGEAEDAEFEQLPFIEAILEHTRAFASPRKGSGHRGGPDPEREWNPDTALPFPRRTKEALERSQRERAERRNQHRGNDSRGNNDRR